MLLLQWMTMMMMFIRLERRGVAVEASGKERILWRFAPSLAVSATRQPSAALFMSNQQSLGMQLAQLSRNAFAAGAARLSSSHQQNVEVDSKKSDSNRTVKYFIQELVDKDLDDANEELNFRALENGYVAITPLSLSPSTDADV